MFNRSFRYSAADIIDSLPTKNDITDAVRSATAKVLSDSMFEISALRVLWVSFGILIGAAFSNFCKKYRWLFFLTFLVSGALFLYKAFQLMDDAESGWDLD